MADEIQKNETSASAGGEVRRPAETQQVAVSAGKASVKKTKYEILSDAIATTLEGYEKNMAVNKSIRAEDGAEWQLRLWRDVIRRVLDLTGVEFHQSYDALLQFVNKHRSGLFNERYAYRFQDRLVTLNRNDRIVYERIMNLMMMTSNPATRQAVLSRYDWTNLRRALQGTGIDEKLSEFYSVL